MIKSVIKVIAWKCLCKVGRLTVTRQPHRLSSDSHSNFAKCWLALRGRPIAISPAHFKPEERHRQTGTNRNLWGEVTNTFLALAGTLKVSSSLRQTPPVVMLKIMQGSVWRVISATSRLTSQGGSHRSYLDGRQWTLPALSVKDQHGWTFSAHVRLPPIKCDYKWLLLLKVSSQRLRHPIQISMKTIFQTKQQSMQDWAVRAGPFSLGRKQQDWKRWNWNGLWCHYRCSN